MVGMVTRRKWWCREDAYGQEVRMERSGWG